MKKTVLVLLIISCSINFSFEQATSVLDCTFDEQNFCGFVSDPEGELTWELRRGPTLTSGTGPESDHTTGDPDNGYYSYIEVSRARNGEFARMISPEVLNTAHKCSTISFYYHMYGDDIGSLNLYLVHDPPPYQLDNPVWGLVGNQGNKWIKGELNITFPRNIKLVFEGFAKLGIVDNKGDIAIDDIFIEVDQCEPITCDPSVNWCKNGGTCMVVSDDPDSSDYYVCECVDGWEGTHCELDFDECANNPCQNGGTCQHGINSYQCSCAIGYHGQNCEYIDKCINPELNRCDNGGTCTPVQEEISCQCAPGYTGTYCDVETDECDPNPCLNGNCTDLLSDYICTCYPDWMGRNCSIHAGGCDFDYDLCGYETTPIVDYTWKSMSGRTPTLTTGPEGDHTTGQGFYMYADASREGNGNARGLLYSPFVTPLAVSSCSTIQFWYHMLGNTIGTLNVYASGTGNNELESNPIWSISGEQGDKWILGEVNLSSAVPYSLIFEAVSVPYVVYTGDIAIDDVEIFPDSCEYEFCSGKPCQNGGTCIESSGNFTCSCTELWSGPTCTEDSDLCLTNPCQNGGTCIDEEKSYTCQCDNSMYVGAQCEYLLGSCDFEDPDFQLCDYSNENIAFPWTLLTGSTPSDLTGPNNDHTTGDGYYIYAEATGRVGGEKARIKTPTIPGSAGKCTHLSFWYFMKGNTVGELAVHIEFGGGPLPTPIWTKVRDDRNGWTNVRINVSVPYDFHVIFEAIMDDRSIIDDDNRGDIAIDDIEVQTDFDCSYQSCFLQPCQNGGTCVAEDDDFTCLCTSEFGGTFCETLNQCDPNPCRNGGTCSSNENNEALCLCRPGFAGDLCENIDYCFPNPCINAVTCTSGDTTHECLCLDGYEGENCELEIDECKTNPCLNGATCDDLLNDYSCQCTDQFIGENCEKVKGSCDFEGDQFCGWIPDPKTDYNWMINSGPGSNWPITGPNYDHTFQSNIAGGYYIYTVLYRDDPADGSLYRIRSPLIPFRDYSNNEFEIELYYHMRGDGIGVVSVYIEENGKPEYSIFQVSGEQGTEWLPMQQSITVTNDWSIIVEHRTVDTRLDLGDAAIDDVKITMVPGEVEPSVEFDCNFDKDFCQFTSDPEGEISWQRKQGPTFTDDTGPESDHTTGNPDEGFYSYLEVSGARTGDFGRILSAAIPVTADQCSTVSFYYHMYGDDIGSLNLYLVHDIPPYQLDNPVWGLVGNQGNQWMKGEISVTFPVDFKLVFEGTAILGVFENQGDIAIDDVRVESGICKPITCDPAVTWCKNGGTCLDVSNNATSEEYYVCDCPLGWEGVHCELDVDECSSNPCRNGGTCAHGVNSFQCLCDVGYHGVNCEYVDQCVDADLSRCNNGGTCVPIQDDISCECAPGYFGPFCETEIDECAALPCIHGTCTDQVNGYTCACKPDWVGYDCDIQQGGCTFDDGLDTCKFTTTPVVDYRWQEISGGTPNFDTGPSGDHTSGNGVYMYADASNEGQGGARALLYSPTLTQETVGACSKIQFWYHMSGNSIGTLNLYASGTGNSELETNPIWSISGDQGDQWKQGEVSLSSQVPYSLIFEAVSVPYVVYRGDIAIDDVTIFPDVCIFEACSGKPCQNGGTCFEDLFGNPLCACTELWTGTFCTEDSDLCLTNPCQNGGTCIDEEKSYTCQCDNSMYVGAQCEYLLGSCDFEDPDLRLCNFINSEQDGNYPWIVTTGATPSDLTGPNNDHTTGDGYYIYAEASGRSAGETSIIRSPMVPGSGGVCSEVSFWYFMRGIDVGELAVLVDLKEGKVASPIWTKVGGDSNGWTNVKINMSAPSDFQLIYEVVFIDKSIIAEDNKGDVAIDDITITTDIGCSYDSCFVQPCLNGGTCIAENDAFKCICRDDFGGPTCETFNPCNPNPCDNNGLCFPDENNQLTCLCSSGYTGPTCSKVDHCFPHPCFNNATCVSGDLTYECLCSNGYEGENCELEIDECKPNPCLNGATCDDLLNDYSCQCIDEFFGKNCQKVVGSCDFEGGFLCGWHSDERSDFDWVIESGSGSNWPLSGPSNDHSQESLIGEEGYYVYTPLYKNEPSAGSLYRIRSPTFLLQDYANNQFIINFYFHMKGDGVGLFNVYIAESGKEESLIFNVEGEQGSEWNFVQKIVTVDNDWSIIFEHRTIVSLLFMGDIAVDDIEITMVPPTPIYTTNAVEATSIGHTVDDVITESSTVPGVITEVPGDPTNSLSAGAVAGIVIGVIVVVLLAIAAFYMFKIRPKQREKENRKILRTQTVDDGGFANPNIDL